MRTIATRNWGWCRGLTRRNSLKIPPQHPLPERLAQVDVPLRVRSDAVDVIKLGRPVTSVTAEKADHFQRLAVQDLHLLVGSVRHVQELLLLIGRERDVECSTLGPAGL